MSNVYIPNDIKDLLSKEELGRLQTQLRGLKDVTSPEEWETARNEVFELIRENFDLSETYDGPEVPKVSDSGHFETQYRTEFDFDQWNRFIR